MKLQTMMSSMTLRQMSVADDLWRAEYPNDGPFQTALSANDWRAIAAIVAAKLRLEGDDTATIETALDMPLDMGDDDAGEVTGGNGGIPRLLSPASGS